MKKIILSLLLVLALTSISLAQSRVTYEPRGRYYRNPYYYNRAYGRRGHPHYYYRAPRYRYSHPYTSYYYYGPDYVTTTEEVYTTGPIVTEEMVVE